MALWNNATTLKKATRPCESVAAAGEWTEAGSRPLNNTTDEAATDAKPMHSFEGLKVVRDGEAATSYRRRLQTGHQDGH
ncbi:hypothetical protein FH972_026357 [Carpinus fangiana]|uniref:Uncharacterized protein n=1 Tax=Carpinus fangiana TaxID=176857 RepID=A0A5N6L6A5_9ROSI|nr:hypothetical protein FH972_026357 [Carpinus fangiana]